MSREIKFRGQRVYTKEWVYGHYVVHHDELGSELHYIVVRPKEIRNATVFGYGNYSGEENYGRLVEVMPGTVCQFTGVLDKNDVEIYEGDILRSIRWYVDCRVAFINGGFTLAEGNTDLTLGAALQMWENDAEIVGNIYELEATNETDKV